MGGLKFRRKVWSRNTECGIWLTDGKSSYEKDETTRGEREEVSVQERRVGKMTGTRRVLV